MEVLWLCDGRKIDRQCKQNFIGLATGQMAFASIGSPKSTVNQNGFEREAGRVLWWAKDEGYVQKIFLNLLISILRNDFFITRPVV